MTEVTARRRRPVSPAMFADLLPGVTVTFPPAAKGWLTVAFDRVLTAEEATAVTERIESTDDADMATRAALRELAVAVAAMEPNATRTLLLHLTTRVLDA